MHPYQKIKRHRFYAQNVATKWRKPPLKNGKDMEGYCNINRRIMYVHPNDDRKEFMNTVIHESMHFLSPMFTEDAVECIAYDITDLLWKLGFRYVPDVENAIAKINEKRKR